MLTLFISVGVTVFLACFFYRSLLAAIPLSFCGIVCFYKIRNSKGKREREELVRQFRECILAVSASLQAGYSVENAFLDCEQDLTLMYGKESLICGEIKLIQRGLHINISLEELLTDLGERSGCEEIIQFAEVFSIAKRNGGNLAEIIASSSELIGRKIELRGEIDALLGGKKMELTIMELMPFAILLYISAANPGYFDMLYHNFFGALIMTGCLVVYVGAYVTGEAVMKHMWNELG